MTLNHLSRVPPPQGTCQKVPSISQLNHRVVVMFFFVYKRGLSNTCSCLVTTSPPRRYSARLANDLSVEFDSSDRRGTGLPYAIVLGNGDVRTANFFFLLFFLTHVTISTAEVQPFFSDTAPRLSRELFFLPSKAGFLREVSGYSGSVLTVSDQNGVLFNMGIFFLEKKGSSEILPSIKSAGVW